MEGEPGGGSVHPGPPRPTGAPDGVRTTSDLPATPTRIVLVRHGEAVCGVTGVIGGLRGCTGLSASGRMQVEALARRLAATGELGAVDALYASALRRATETAEILAPALERWRSGAPLEIALDCELCELHPGEADGLTWADYAARYRVPDWSSDADTAFSPGGESWSGFVERASGALAQLAVRHRGQTVVVACHAGVVEASILRLLPVDRSVVRLGLRTSHASLTVWEHAEGRWLLQRYNDLQAEPAPDGPARVHR